MRAALAVLALVATAGASDAPPEKPPAIARPLCWDLRSYRDVEPPYGEEGRATPEDASKLPAYASVTWEDSHRVRVAVCDGLRHRVTLRITSYNYRHGPKIFIRDASGAELARIPMLRRPARCYLSLEVDGEILIEAPRTVEIREILCDGMRR